MSVDLERATCLLDGRSFVTFDAMRAHCLGVHLRDAASLPFHFVLITDDGEREESVRVPQFLIRADQAVDEEVESDVDYGQDACDNCMANTSAAFLPVHDDCDCEPAEGWDVYIESLDQPEDASDNQWKDFLTFLKRNAHKVKQ